ncbi:MAG: hypothetical protein H8D78_04935 [Chloroflexi bacterium]|nr:hypothetical protein [Chloroflexota bacterium]
MSLDRFITLEEAASAYNLDVMQLTGWANDGTITAGRLDGKLLLKEADVRQMAQGDTSLPRLITPAEAARRYNIPEGVLGRFVEEGRVRRGASDGFPLVVEQDVQELARKVSRNRFAHLEGRPIRLTKAEEKYGIPNPTLSRWAHSGRIRILRRGPKLLEMDEADVAYARLLADMLGMRKGRGVLPQTL